MTRLPFLILTCLLLILTACQATPPAEVTPVVVTSLPTLTGPIVTPQPMTATPTPEPTTPATTDIFPNAPLPLSAFPRPPNDNGLGVHWSTHLYAQSDEATSYFVSELTRLNIKWVKLLVDGTTNYDYDHTIEELVSREIMPIIRIYQQCNEPYEATELAAMVRHFREKGGYYFETYNEPNIPGEKGGWCQEGGQPQPAYLAEVWADMARIIYQAGGYPSLPSFFAPSQKRANWQQDFFYRFFEALREQGNEEVLYFSWGAIHNYHLNHPPVYPYDEVNLTDRLLTEAEILRYDLSPAEVMAINEARRTAREPGGFFLGDNLYDDSTAFFHFIAYRNQFYDLFGFEIPLISTEGGATKGSAEDPRYPAVDGPTVAEWTVWSADYMLDDAPDYYFSTMSWLLAQGALDYQEPVWESNAWYHDREGDQEPVVEALKNRPRKGQVRQVCNTGTIWQPANNPADNACYAAKVEPTVSPINLADYPRPPQDNGRGVHGSPTNQPLSPEVVDYFIGELKAMNIKWYKFLQDDAPTVTDPYLIEQLVTHDIEPIMRVYKPFNERYDHLLELVAAAGALGVHYFELYNEPNVAGPAGGWREGEPISVGRMAELWILAARQVHQAGGHPSLPPLAGGGTVDDKVFLRSFLAEVQARQQERLFGGAWMPVHNYFLNHPLDYPTDPVNVNDVPLTEADIEAWGLTPEEAEAINQARRIAKLPREEGGFWVGNTIDEDSNAFRKFEAYANILQARLGYLIPVISTEGGAVAGAAEDPRYPPLRDEEVARLTLAAYHYLLDEAPAYFFAHTPWLLANQAAEGHDERFEQAAWYKNRQGDTLPVVDRLKADARKLEAR